MTARNPFTPTFGIVPPYLAGRDDLLDDMRGAFDNGLGDPNLCTLLVGPRGSGKTALLCCLGDVARECGWVVVDAVAERGMLEDILQHAQAAASQLVGTQKGRRVVGVSVADVVGIEWEAAEHEAPSWRMGMESLLTRLGERGVGILITVDEVRADVEEMVRLASAYQLFIRAGFLVALVMAGLPANVTDLVGNDSVSFLRRARQRRLERIGDPEVARAFRKTLEQEGRAIDADALAAAVGASQGFPYMIQLVGYNMWKEAGDRPTITASDARQGVEDARADFRAGVLDRTWRGMSKGDRAFACGMLADAAGSTLTDVASRMGRGTNYASTYKRRLLRQGIIGERPGGTFDFDLPMMREYAQGMCREGT